LLSFSFFSYTCSSDFSSVLTACLDASFEVFANHLKIGAYGSPLTSVSTQLPADDKDLSASPSKVESHSTVPLAKLLAHVAKEAHLVLNGMPNEYLDVCQEIYFFPFIFFSSETFGCDQNEDAFLNMNLFYVMSFSPCAELNLDFLTKSNT